MSRKSERQLAEAQALMNGVSVEEFVAELGVGDTSRASLLADLFGLPPDFLDDKRPKQAPRVTQTGPGRRSTRKPQTETEVEPELEPEEK